MKRIVLSVLVTVAATVICSAQASLGFANVAITPSNLHVADTVFIAAQLVNYGNATFNDSLHFGLRHNGINVSDPQIWPSPYTNGVAHVEHIDPGDNILLHFKLVLKGTEFSEGVTGVVIWPILINQNGFIHDSIKATLNIQVRSGIDEQADMEKGFNCAIINRTLHVSSNVPAQDFSQLSLFNVAGQLLFSTKQVMPIDIPLEDFPTGVYVLQMGLSDGSKISKKVFVTSK